MLQYSGTFSGYSVDDQAAALDFYRDKLGVEVDSTDMGLRLRLPGGEVFIYPKDDHVPATYTVLNFEVTDIDEAVAQLGAAGITLERYPGMPQDKSGVMRGKAAGMGPDIAWFTDPAGNVLSILTE
jgi:catechol 2,3-dioxygenase-like lactoylglutathione lyase family enzyme